MHWLVKRSPFNCTVRLYCQQCRRLQYYVYVTSKFVSFPSFGMDRLPSSRVTTLLSVHQNVWRLFVGHLLRPVSSFDHFNSIAPLSFSTRCNSHNRRLHCLDHSLRTPNGMGATSLTLIRAVVTASIHAATENANSLLVQSLQAAKLFERFVLEELDGNARSSRLY